jgi:hypothetical protein
MSLLRSLSDRFRSLFRKERVEGRMEVCGAIIPIRNAASTARRV